MKSLCANNSPKPLINAPSVGISKLNCMIAVGSCGILATPHRPAMTPTTAVPIKPQNTAAVTFFANRINVSARPKIASRTTGSVNFPKATNVDSFATMMPAFFKPMNAMKKPIPAPIASFSCCGIALMIILRKPVTEMTMKIIPETKTAAKAACQL